jgi:DNA-binding GntR family transcriptional regulator
LEDPPLPVAGEPAPQDRSDQPISALTIDHRLSIVNLVSDAKQAPTGIVERTVLRNQAKQVILDRILTGHYGPGERLVETQIARELGVSQGSIREALRELESVGVIEYAAFRGSRVVEPSREELLQAFPVRAALESLAAREAATRLTEPELKQLESEIQTMEEAAETGDARAQSLANARFHAQIVHAAGNPILERQWQMLEPFARTYLTVAHAEVDLNVLAGRHRPVLECLRGHDAEGAAAAMHDHLAEAAGWLAEGDEEE